jgi:hypothetical protein
VTSSLNQLIRHEHSMLLLLLRRSKKRDNTGTGMFLARSLHAVGVYRYYIRATSYVFMNTIIRTMTYCHNSRHQDFRNHLSFFLPVPSRPVAFQSPRATHRGGTFRFPIRERRARVNQLRPFTQQVDRMIEDRGRGSRV